MGTGSYFDKALTETNDELVETMRHNLKGVKYDTIVGTGLSGTIFTARVAPDLRKKFAIVRKKDDTSTHSGSKIEGHVGSRWVFADDFVSMGGTLKRVLKMMKEYYPDAVFVGIYQYEGSDFSTPDEAAYRWGNWVTELSTGILEGPKTLAQVKKETPWDTGPLTAPLAGWDQRVRDKIPMGPRASLTVDYQDEYGRPTIYDRSTRMRWTCEDSRALPLIEEVEKAALESGTSTRRMIGERLDRLPKPRVPVRNVVDAPRGWDWKTPAWVEGMEKFADAVIDNEKNLEGLRAVMRGE